MFYENVLHLMYKYIYLYIIPSLTFPCFCCQQSIQRRLEEIEVTFKDLEDKGVVLEQTLRGEEGEDPKSRRGHVLY